MGKQRDHGKVEGAGKYGACRDCKVSGELAGEEGVTQVTERIIEQPGDSGFGRK
jgi:hypothetical protein